MKPLPPRPGLTEQVYQTLLDEISDGRLAPGTHLVQEDLAAALGVSRQPIQQSLALLKNEGLVQELGRRGLFVAPLDASLIRHHYEIRAALDMLAARRAAEQAAASKPTAAAVARRGRDLLASGDAAVASGQVAEMVRCDTDFHNFIYEASGNPLLAQTAAVHWRQIRRVMGEAIRQPEARAIIWRQHRDILDAVARGDADGAEAAAAVHMWSAVDRLERALTETARPPAATGRSRSRTGTGRSGSSDGSE